MSLIGIIASSQGKTAKATGGTITFQVVMLITLLLVMELLPQRLI